MKTFNGGLWVDGNLDTGRRDISSSLDFTVKPYYFRSAPRDDDLYQVEPGEVDLKCTVRRRGFKVNLTLDVISVVSDFAANYGVLIPGGSANPIKKIGAPSGTAGSQERAIFSSTSNPTPGNTERLYDDSIVVLGSGFGVRSQDENALVWLGGIKLNPGRYTLRWVTPDPFPTSIIGVSA